MAQRTCDVLGRLAAPDTPAAVDTGHVKGCKGKGKPKGHGKLYGMSGQKGEDAKGRDVNGASSQSVDVRFPGESGYRRKRRQTRGMPENKTRIRAENSDSQPGAVTGVSRWSRKFSVHSTGKVHRSKILVDYGADEHMMLTTVRGCSTAWTCERRDCCMTRRCRRSSIGWCATHTQLGASSRDTLSRCPCASLSLHLCDWEACGRTYQYVASM